MSIVKMVRPELTKYPDALAILDWLIEMEALIPNHFLVELNFSDYSKAKLGSTKILWEHGELSIEEIQHLRILVPRINRCPYCTAARCTIVKHGLGWDENFYQPAQ